MRSLKTPPALSRNRECQSPPREGPLRDRPRPSHNLVAISAGHVASSGQLVVRRCPLVRCRTPCRRLGDAFSKKLARLNKHAPSLVDSFTPTGEHTGLAANVIAPVDIAWQRFGRLVAIAPFKKTNSNGDRLWRCLCDCGTRMIVGVHDLRRGKARSCGCAKKERFRRLAKARVERKKSETDAKLIGKYFGTRVVIGRSGAPGHFLVRCHQCGAERTMPGNRISRARPCLCTR